MDFYQRFSCVGKHLLSTAAESTIRVNGTREDDGVGRSMTVGDVAHPDTTTHRHNHTRPRFRDDKHTRQDRHRHEREVGLYNQALIRYNDRAQISATIPTPVVVVKEKEPTSTTDIMGEIVTTLPKALQEKGRQLVSRLKTTKWDDIGELVHVRSVRTRQ